MKKRIPAGILLALASCAVQADYQDLQIARTVERVAAIESYSGELTQTGLFGSTPVVSEVAFRRPHDIWTKVTSPALLAGTVTRYTPDELLVWSPQQELALRIRHLTAPETASEGKRIEDAWRTNTDSYLYGFGKVQEVAGLPTIAIDQRARHGGQLIQSSLTRVYDDFSVPLAGTVTLRGGARLDYRYNRVAFNNNAVVPPMPVPPASTLLVEWDMAAAGRSEADVAARVPKALPFPAKLGGLARDRLLIHPDAVPAVAGWYRDADYYLLVTASRDTGFMPLRDEKGPREYGLKVPLGERALDAHLVLTPWLSTWSFRRDGVLYTVLSNLHPETLYRELGTHWGAGGKTTGSQKP
ncbi:MAG: LolA family protein [Pseudomonadota bacterium]